jgi:hypothetical protein
MFLYRRLKTFGGWVVKFKGIEVRFNALQKWNEGTKYTVKNALIDPEKCIRLWPVNDGDPEWTCFAE